MPELLLEIGCEEVPASWLPDLAEARNRAIASRPEIEQARLKVQESDLDRRKKKSEFIPDVALSVSYYSAFNVSSALPRNVAIAGVQTSWEPFDWGRKRRELAQKEKSTRQSEVALRDLEEKVRIEVGTAGSCVERAGDVQRGVADDLGFHTAWVGSTVIKVLRVNHNIGHWCLVVGHSRRGRQPVGPAGDDQLVDRLHAPAVFQQFHG